MTGDGKAAGRVGEPEDLPQDTASHVLASQGCGHKNGLRIKKGHPQAEQSVWGFFWPKG